MVFIAKILFFFFFCLVAKQYCFHTIFSVGATKEIAVVENKAGEKSKSDSIIVIGDSFSDDDVIFVGQSNKEDADKSNDTEYFADSSSSSSQLESPPDRTSFLRLLYEGNGHLIPDKNLLPPPRFDSTAINANNQSTPKKDA